MPSPSGEGAKDPDQPAELRPDPSPEQTRTQTGLGEKLIEATQNVGEKATGVALVAPEKTEEESEHLRLDQVVYFHVEDEASIAMLTEHVLRGIGITGGVTAQLSGLNLEQAIEKFEAALKRGVAISLVFLDQQFPQSRDTPGEPAVNFVTAIKRFQQMPEYKELLKNLRTIVFFSSSASEEDRQTLRRIVPEYSIQLVRKPPKNADLKKAAVIGLLNSNVISVAEAAKGLTTISEQHPDDVK